MHIRVKEKGRKKVEIIGLGGLKGIGASETNKKGFLGLSGSSKEISDKWQVGC